MAKPSLLNPEGRQWMNDLATDDDGDLADWVCDICHGDGMDPWTDYLLPCQCQGEQKPSKEPTP